MSKKLSRKLKMSSFDGEKIGFIARKNVVKLSVKLSVKYDGGGLR
jgi:hypothetical protein